MKTTAVPPGLDGQVDAAMAASRVFVAIVVASMDGAEPVVSLRQLRALVMLAGQGPMNVATLAGRLEVHPSNATRLCDQLVKSHLMQRHQSDEDRRSVVLTPTPKGRRLVNQVMDQRRTAIRDVLTEMTERDRDHLTDALVSFATAAGEVRSDSMWTT